MELVKARKLPFFNLQTWLGLDNSLNPGGCAIKTVAVNAPFRKALLTSICLKSHPFMTEIDNTVLIVVGLTTGLKVSL